MKLSLLILITFASFCFSTALKDSRVEISLQDTANKALCVIYQSDSGKISVHLYRQTLTGDEVKTISEWIDKLGGSAKSENTPQIFNGHPGWSITPNQYLQLDGR